MLRRTLRISVFEGAFAQIYMSLSGPGSVFITRFAVMLNASPVHFGLLSAIGQLSQVFQPLGALITRKSESRKGMVLLFALCGRILTVLIGIIPFVMSGFNAMAIFLLLFFLSTALQAVAGNAWIAWISDSVPLRFRGRFFSVRSRYLLVIGLISGLSAGAFIDWYEKSGTGLAAGNWLGSLSETGSNLLLSHGFLALFSLAALIGVLGIAVLRRQPEYPKAVESDSIGVMLLQPLRDKNFRRLLGFTAWWMMAIGIGSPFWQPFMIEKLHLSIMAIQVYGLISTCASLLVLKKWGRFIDRFGNKTAMGIAIVMGGFNPLIWVTATPGSYWMLYCEAATSGIMWAGAGIVAVNFVLAIAPPNKRQIYSGLHGAVSGLAMMITMILSGWLLPRVATMNAGRLEPEQVLFAVTGVLRWSALIPLLWIFDARSQGLTHVVVYFRQYSKVRMTHMADRMLRHLPFLSPADDGTEQDQSG